MTIQAKMRCSQIIDDGYGHKISLTAVYDPDPSHPNYIWSEATPSGDCSLYVTNKVVHGIFKTNKEYLLTFEEVVS